MFIPEDQNKFKSLVKSFLLNTGMTIKHKSVTAYEIIMAYVNQNEDCSIQDLIDEDLLIIHLIKDLKNVAYRQVIPYILQEREKRNNPVWIFSKFLPAIISNCHPCLNQHISKAFSIDIHISGYPEILASLHILRLSAPLTIVPVLIGIYS